MPSWAWVIIAVAAVIVIAGLVYAAISQRRSERLKSRFGPEYDRALEEKDSRREAEAELQAREQRRQSLNVRPLTPEARERYSTEWQLVQAQFVDAPATAVASADLLIQNVMRDRGYPVDDFETRAADISVDHPQVVANYREGHRLCQAAETGQSQTEDLRQAMQHYRALFSELVADGVAAPPPTPAQAQPMPPAPSAEALARDRDLAAERAQSATAAGTAPAEPALGASEPVTPATAPPSRQP